MVSEGRATVAPDGLKLQGLTADNKDRGAMASSDASEMKAGGHDGGPAVPVDALRGELAQLGRERELLRAMGARRDELERNRCAIVRAHQDLSRALIAHHSPGLHAA